jgi:hypothetical protein
MKYRKYPNWVIITNKEIPFPYTKRLVPIIALKLCHVKSYNTKNTLYFMHKCNIGTKLGMSTAYHPQTDRQSEKANDIIGIWPRALARESEQAELDRLLPIAECAYNSTPQASTRKTPFELDLGYHPRWPMDLMIQTVIEAL